MISIGLGILSAILPFAAGPPIEPPSGLDPASIRSSAGVAYGSRTNTTIAAPSGVQDGDILLMFFGVAGATAPTPTFPAGFSTAAGPIFNTVSFFSVNYHCVWKRASSESGDYTVTHSVGSSFAFMLCISGAKASGSPINAISASSGAGVTTTATGITPTADNCLIIFGAHDWGDTGNNLSPPSGSTPTFAELLDSTLRYYADGVLATAGATGDKSITNNSVSGSNWGVYLVAIAPAGS